MAVIVTVFEAAGLTVSEKTETMLLRTPDQAPCTSPLVIEAAGQRYRQTTQFLYLRSYRRKRRYYVRDQTAGPTRMGMLQSIQAGAVRYGGCPVRSEGALAKAEVVETLLYGCVTWTLGKEHVAELRTAHHRFLLRIIGFQRRQRIDHLMSYDKALKGTLALAHPLAPAFSFPTT